MLSTLLGFDFCIKLSSSSSSSSSTSSGSSISFLCVLLYLIVWHKSNQLAIKNLDQSLNCLWNQLNLNLPITNFKFTFESDLELFLFFYDSLPTYYKQRFFVGLFCSGTFQNLLFFMLFYYFA